ncbi:MAG: hypothetical protein HYS26_01885 [Candidatus Kaiserbacteria bacterium]|nr:MAG: hypothetical protein HYS26_01885 [Candidatus Kaiserbacteria bacterium]
MNTFFPQLKNEANKIRLSEGEKNFMRFKLEEAMRAPVPSPYFSFAAPRTLVPALVLVLVVIGGGMTYAAEGALPGDLLYPVKIGFNESVRSALAFSDESKVAVHSVFAERRLEEATALAVSGRLSGAAQKALEANFDAHAEVITTIVAEVEATDPIAAADLSARFDSKIAAKGAVIASIGAGSKDTTTKETSGAIAANISRFTGRIARADAPITMQMSAEGAADSAEVSARSFAKATLAPLPVETDTDTAIAAKIGENVLDLLAEVDVRLNALSESLGATTTARIQKQIFFIREFIERTQEHEGDSATARRNIEQALRDVAKLEAFLEAQEKFHTKILPTSLETDVEGAVLIEGGADTRTLPL